MKIRNLAIVLAIVIFCGLAFGQSHSVTLTWTASPDSTSSTPGTVTVYRAAAACPASGIGALSYTALTATAPAAGPYSDTTVTVGTFCYYITATIAGATSQPSNTVQTGIVPLAPGSLKIGSSD